jgi:hypothetical protein
MPLKSLAQTSNDELTPEEAAAAVSVVDSEPDELSPEDAAKLVSVPERPSALQAYTGSALERTADIAGLGRVASEKVSGALGLSQETPFFSGLEAGLHGLAQQAYPQEQRGRGGVTEQLAQGLGSISAASPAGALGGGAAVLTYGAQTAMPLYYDVLHATGDKTKAMKGLLFGFAAGQLERFGAEKYAGGILKKLATGKLGAAVKNLVMHTAVGGGSEAITEAAQQGLTDLAQETLTGEDLDNWERIKAVVPPALLLGGGFAAVDGVLSRIGGHGGEKAGIVEDVAVKAQDGATEPVVAPEAAAALQEAPAATEAPVAPEATPAPTEGADFLGPPETTPEQAAAPEAAAPDEAQAAEAPATEKPTEATGVKHAEVDKQIEEMGLDAIEKDDVRGREQVFGEALDIYKKDQRAGENLTRKLEEDPSGASDTDKALLSIEAARLVKARDAAEAAFNKDPSKANKAAVEAARNDYYRAGQTFKRVGTESGRSLNAQKILVNNDFTLAAMESSARVANAGKPLSEADLGKVKALNEKIAATKLAHEDYLAKATAEKAALEADIKSLKSEKKQATGERPTLTLRKKKIEASKKRIADIQTKLGISQKAAAFGPLDPEKISLTAQLAKEYVNLGYQSFAKFAAEVVAKVGEHIRPYLRQAWDDAQGERDKKNIERYKARKRTDIAKIGEKIATGDTSTGRRRTPIENDPEAIDLQIAHEQAKREFEHFKRQKERANRTKAQKVMDAAAGSVRVHRALKASLDDSAALVQGVFHTFAHPIKSAGYIGESLRAMRSEQGARRIEARTKNDPAYTEAENIGKVEFSSWDEGPNPAEETFFDGAFAKIPGIRASSRGMSTLLNLYRLNMYKAMRGGIESPTTHELKVLGKAVNVFTGRGNAGDPNSKLSRGMDAAGVLFFSPRNWLSKVQMAVFQPLYRGTSRTRKAIGKQYARAVVGALSFYALKALYDKATYHKEEGVLSSKFAKPQVKNTFVDVYGGMTQLLTLGARLWTGKKKTASNEEVAIRGEDVPYKGDTPEDLLGSYIRNKYAPAPNLFLDILNGEGRYGEKLNTEYWLKEGLAPISLGNLYDNLKDNGLSATAALAVVNFFGGNTVTYTAKSKK